VHVNLASQLQLTGPINYGADLTYVRLRERFVYLAVILDAIFPQSKSVVVATAMHSG